MCRRYIIVAMAFATVVLLKGLVGCKGPTGPQGPEGPTASLIYVLGGVELELSLFEPTPDARVKVTNSPGIPSVKINDIEVPLWSQYPPYSYEDLMYRDDSFPISAGDSAKLLVNYTKLDGNSGIAQAKVVLPDLEITSHLISSWFPISVGDSVTVTWTSRGTNAHWIDFAL